METIWVARRVLSRAAAKLGGVDALASYLGIGHDTLRLYIDGREPVPDVLFLRALDLSLEEVPPVLPDTPHGEQAAPAEKT